MKYLKFFLSIALAFALISIPTSSVFAEESQILIENATYTFRNAASNKMLNLYAGNSADGTNVVQYTEDGSNEQNRMGF